MYYRPTFFIIASVTLLASASAVYAAGPTISTVSYPSGVTSNVATTLSVSVSSAAGIQSCNLYVDSEDTGAMTLSSGAASKNYTFPRGGVFTLFVFCRDNGGGMASGPNTSIFVQGPIVQTPSFGGGSSSGSQTQTESPDSMSSTETSTSSTESELPSEEMVVTPVSGMLVKLACPAEVPVGHPCTAVYYVSEDGSRRAFPNEKAYKTWYADFDNVQIVSPEAMSALPLGKNVTYRPGVRMVKFTTLARVYAVSRGGRLRWIQTEEVARSLYGDTWNKQIDDISDAFFTNYEFGTDIANATDYDPTSERDVSSDINTEEAGIQ